MAWRSMIAAGVLAMGLAATAAPASAGYLYNNLSQSSNTLSASAVEFSGPLGAQFKTNALTDGISSVELLLTGTDLGASGGSFVVTIVGDATNAPNFGDVIHTYTPFNDNALTPSSSYWSWNSGSVFVDLDPSSTYWVVLSDNGGSAVEWTFGADSSGAPGNLGELFRYSDGSSFVNEGAGPFVMAVDCVGLFEQACGSNISEVPEPATIGILGAGMVALGVAIRRRRNGTV